MRLDNFLIKILKNGITAKEIIDREINRECLICGNSIKKEILGKEKVTLHFCFNCRKELMEFENGK